MDIRWCKNTWYILHVLFRSCVEYISAADRSTYLHFSFIYRGIYRCYINEYFNDGINVGRWCSHLHSVLESDISEFIQECCQWIISQVLWEEKEKGVKLKSVLYVYNFYLLIIGYKLLSINLTQGHVGVTNSVSAVLFIAVRWHSVTQYRSEAKNVMIGRYTVWTVESKWASLVGNYLSFSPRSRGEKPKGAIMEKKFTFFHSTSWVK